MPSTPRDDLPQRDPAQPLPGNGDLAALFHEIGDLLEIKGELVFKTAAYHRAADTIAHSPLEIARLYADGKPPAIPGVGKAISDKIAEFVATGSLRMLERTRTEVPPTLTQILAIPGVGPKTVRLLWERFGITDLAGLEVALAAGAIEPGKGFSAKTIEGIRAAAAVRSKRDNRMTLGQAEAIINAVGELLRDTAGLRVADPGRLLPPSPRDDRRPRPPGRNRRSRRDRCPLHQPSPGRRRPGHRAPQGERPAPAGPPGRPDDDAARDRRAPISSTSRGARNTTSPSAGSPATAAGASARRDSSGSATTASRSPATPRSCAPSRPKPRSTRFLDLPFIEPELRENRGEIEAAREGRLPRLVTPARPPRRLPRPLGLVRRRPHDRADGRDRPRPRLLLHGSHRPHPEPRRRERSDARAASSPSGRSSAA